MSHQWESSSQQGCWFYAKTQQMRFRDPVLRTCAHCGVKAYEIRGVYYEATSDQVAGRPIGSCEQEQLRVAEKVMDT